MLLAGGIASAHVTANVYGDDPEQGGYGAIVLRVPNEEAQVGTTKLEMTLDPEYGITSARTKPVPGWTAEVTETDDVVTKITWTAEEGHEIAAGSHSYEEFEFLIGALPDDVDTLVLPTAQTYSDGKTVNWEQPPTESAPERPAPVVELAESSGSGHGHGGTDEAEDAQGSEESTDASDGTARLLGGAGLVLGALGFGLGVGATLRARKAGKS
ncbi:YcnI family protein [Saccharomonospora sp.]|uniref:YcnI family copper-binding membrane protein n=1 Tax=Saccharomonospora sp. TaxID=33913 RepID=UPI002619E7CC|nr:YcnI family protein [Saccharomonospora sp.]